MSGSKWATQSDDALMQAAIAGDDAAFEALAFRLHPRLVRFCAKFTSKYDEADDLAQETLIRLWGARGRYSANAPLLAFVLTIARNVCLQNARGANRRALRIVSSGEVNDAAISGPHAIELIAAAQRQVALKVALQALPDAQREAVLLRFDQGLDYSTIAQMLGRSESTIRSQVFYGLKKLRELLQVQESA